MRYFLKNYRPMMVVCIYMLAIVGVSMMLSGCATAKQRPTERSAVKDSVVYVYKTVVRDSVRMRDSIVISEKIKWKDSTVLHVDNATGKILKQESWHWKDTDKDRVSNTDVRNFRRADSLASASVKKDSSSVVRPGTNKAAVQKKTYYWRTFGIGVIAGLLIAFVWKYRKKIFHLLSSIFIS